MGYLNTKGQITLTKLYTMVTWLWPNMGYLRAKGQLTLTNCTLWSEIKLVFSCIRVLVSDKLKEVWYKKSNVNNSTKFVDFKLI